MKLETTPDGVMGSVKDTVNIKTNIPSGFKLFLSTNSDNTNSNRLNKDGSLSASHFVSASNGTITAPKALTMNTWGFAIKKDSSNPFSTAFDDNYLTPYPSETSKWAGVGIKTAPNAILSTASANDTSGVNLDVYYGLRVNMSLPKGSYKSEVVYTALANLSSISGATVSSGYELEVNPTQTNNLSGGETITIKTSLFGKNGITTTGTGGSTTAQNPDLGTITATIGGSACTGLNSSLSSGMLTVTCKTPAKTVGKYEVKVSIPKHSITISKANAFEYKPSQTTFNSITTMQQMTTQICANETTPTPSAATSTREHSTNTNLVPEAELKDIRDNKTYTIRKLADGRCWMVQNLDLDLSTGTALASATSDVSSNWTPNNSTQNSAGTSWGEYNNPTNQARSYNPGDKYLTGTGSADQTVGDSGPKTAHVGNFYNWYAATAGSGTYSMSTPGQTAPYSICPKGWKLPYGNNSQSQTENYGDFRKLTNTYGITSGAGNGSSDNRLLSAPLSFVRSGLYGYSNGSYFHQGSVGYFWSSSVYNQGNAHYLLFGSSYVYPQNFNVKGLGFSVRCVAREDNHTTFSGIKTMQEMTSQICNNETTPYVYQNGATSGEIVGTTTRTHSTNKNLVPEAILRDTRDNKTYVIRKLADGRCWMVQNLDLDLSTGTALTPSTSDVSSNWTPNNNTQTSTGTAWSYDTSDNQARSYNPGDKYLTGTGSANQTVSNSGPKTAHVGNLYNWYAATAGSGTYSMSTSGQTASYSICPKGWKLPYGNNSDSYTENYGDFRKLTNTYGATSGSNTGSSDSRLLSAPLNFIRSGSYGYGDGSYYNQGSGGYFWSSSVYSQADAHRLAFISSYVAPQYYSNKGHGFSVRCLAR